MSRKKIRKYLRRAAGLAEWALVFGMVIAGLTLIQAILRRPLTYKVGDVANSLIWYNSTVPSLDGEVLSKMRSAQRQKDDTANLEQRGGVLVTSTNQQRSDKSISVSVGTPDAKAQLDTYDISNEQIKP